MKDTTHTTPEMKIRLNIDGKLGEYTSKPQGAEIGSLRNRLCHPSSIREVTPNDLVKCIVAGRSFTPAVMDGKSHDAWKSQQIIAADIDNDTTDADGHKVCLEDPLTPEQALELCHENGINPLCIYKSFSYTEEWPRFRILILLDAPLTDPKEACRLGKRFTQLFNGRCPGCADTTVNENARLLFGAKAGGNRKSIIYQTEEATTADKLRDLPPSEDEIEENNRREAETAIEKASERSDQERKANNTTSKSGNRYTPGVHPAYDALEDQFKTDKMNFDLAAYILRTAGGSVHGIGRHNFINPCPICGHKDDFQITGAVFRCHSSHGLKGAGGGIVEYLMYREGLQLNDAIDKAKYDVLGYDRDLWSREYKKMLQAADDARADKIAKEYKENRALMAEQTANKAASGADQGEQTSEQTASAATQDKQVTDYGLATYMQNSMLADIDLYKQNEIKTGFTNYDKAAGGIYPGLYLLAAVPSLGKTSFALQLADQIAEAGHDVLFFSLEQPRLEIAAKSLSRTIAKHEHIARSARSILKGEAKDYMQQAIHDYTQATGNRMQVIEGNFDLSVTKIEECIKQHIAKKKSVPVVFVDYLQILPPLDVRQTTKDAVDSNIIALKRLARDLVCPVIAISSMNRSSYTESVTMASLKESGGLEYTADVILGLELEIVENKSYKNKKLNEQTALAEKAKAEMPRKLCLKCIKHRLGSIGFRCYFNFKPDIDLFTERNSADTYPELEREEKKNKKSDIEPPSEWLSADD